MNPISASINTNYKYNTPSFGKVTKVSYVVVDGHSESDKEIVEDVTKHFIRQIKFGRPEDKELRRSLLKATGDSSLAQAYQSIAKIGRHIVTGQDAIDLENNWKMDLPLQQKKHKAADLVRKMFNYNYNSEKIALVVERTKSKKDKYIITDLYKTIY